MADSDTCLAATGAAPEADGSPPPPGPRTGTTVTAVSSMTLTQSFMASSLSACNARRGDLDNWSRIQNLNGSKSYNKWIQGLKYAV